MALTRDSIGLLDLPAEILTNIMAKSQPRDLVAIACSCNILHQYAIPILWHNISLDLTISSTRETHHFYDSSTSTRICDAINSKKVSELAYSSIRSLAFNLSPLSDNNSICGHLINPDLLPNLRELTVHGATDWARVEPIAMYLSQYSSGKCSLRLNDIPLACLVEVALPVSTINPMISSVAVTFSSVVNTATDVDLLASTLALLPNLKSFALSFDPEFDLCDDARLDARFAALFRNFAINNRKLTRIAIYDFPPYLHFDPTCLPCSISEFVFHTNEIDDAPLFYVQLLDMSARLQNLSLRIVQSVSSTSSVSFTEAKTQKKIYAPMGLTGLRALTLDVPADESGAALLQTLLHRNSSHLARVALSGFTTATLCGLLTYVRAALCELYIYSFAPGAAAACGALVLRAAHSNQFRDLRLLALPSLGAAELARCVALRRTATTKPAFALITMAISDTNDRLTINTSNGISDKINTKFALGCGGGKLPLPQLMVTPPMSPVPFSSENDHNNDENNNKNDDVESLDTLQQCGTYSLLDQTALWKTIPFKSEDELDLFMFHSGTAASGLGQLCVL